MFAPPSRADRVAAFQTHCDLGQVSGRSRWAAQEAAVWQMSSTGFAALRAHRHEWVCSRIDNTVAMMKTRLHGDHGRRSWKA